jgi:hypothetical protein
VKASSRKTLQPSPISLSEAQSSPYIAGTTGITQRVAALRGECLKRDRHRCVISGRFDDAEALERVEREGDDEAKDDDGHKLKREAGTFAPLEVAHILPHSLMNVGSGGGELVCTPLCWNSFFYLSLSPDRFFRMTPRKPP